MTDFLSPERTAPLFYYLQFIFEKLTILNFNTNGRLKKITIYAGASECVICSDQHQLNIQDWTERSKDFNIGKNVVIDGKSDVLEVVAETAVDGLLKGQVSIGSVGNGKPTRRIIQLCGQDNVPALELQCIIFKRPLHYQLDVGQKITTQSTSAAQTTGVTKISVGTQTEQQVKFKEVGVNSTQNEQSDKLMQTDEYHGTSAHQKQVLMRMVIMLINRVHARLLEYQLTQKSDKVASKQVNTGTLPATLTQQELNNSISSEHLQAMKKRLQDLSKQHRESLLKEQTTQLVRVKRICRTRNEKLTKVPVVKPQKPLQMVERSLPTKQKEAAKKEEFSSPKSIKSWISSLHSEDPKLESSSKVTNLSQKTKSPTKSPAKTPTKTSAKASSKASESSSSSEDVSSKALSDEEETSSEATQSQTDSSDTTESESAEDEESSSVEEEIDKSSGSSIPTEIDSHAPLSEQSYLESVATSSDSAAKKPLASDLSPTSAYLQKLRNDVLRTRS